MESRFPVAAAPSSRLAAWRVISENREASDRAIVTGLRRAGARYPHDKRLAALIRRTLDGNEHHPRLDLLSLEGQTHPEAGQDEPAKFAGRRTRAPPGDGPSGSLAPSVRHRPYRQRPARR